ncbi:MAG TPA: flagellar basal body rod protein FlgB [Anaerolineaceae bacterium]|nr:flagellar basal body rod protein FlgB [Anaerolineaceae bacterium]
MTDSFLLDDSLKASSIALDGLSLRQQMISRNISNADTPGYRAQTVQFEDFVKQALNKAGQLPLQVTNASHLIAKNESNSIQLINRPGSTLRADQNDVDINVEMTDMTDTAIKFQTITTEVSKKLLLLKTIASAR